MTSSLFYLLIFIAFGAGAGTAVWYFFQRAREHNRVSGSLQLVLYVVLLPQESTANEQERRDPKDIISIMEQFYAGMVSRDEVRTLGFLTDRPSFALEIALPSVGEETTFYVAVPRKWSRVFEKKVSALFPHARVEQIKDYNIFNEDGVTVGSTLRLKRAPFFPIKSYRRLEADPLEVLTTAFSKMKKGGDGAAIQLVVRPASSEWQEKGKQTARFLKKGKSLKEISKTDSWQGVATGVAGALMGGAKKKQKENELQKAR